jgi:hypothetical protein
MEMTSMKSEHDPTQMRLQLLPHHQELLEASKISPEVAEARGYCSVTTATELASFGFAQWQRNVPTLVMPICDVNGQQVFFQSRPDDPRIGSNGKPIKYETVAGARMRLDVPPPVQGQLGDPRVTLYITEGVRKADSAVSAGLCCIDVLGVWNWRGTNEKGEKTALGCWDSVELNNREVFIVFDSDVTVKPNVAQALAGLKKFLESRHALVKIVYLPDGAGGTKVGLDDFLAAGHTIEELHSFATPELRDEASPTPFRLKTFSEIKELPRRTSLVGNVLHAGELAVLAAPSGSGKSFTTLDLAASITTGTPWLGKPVQQGPVVYVLAEGAPGFRLRVGAWEVARGQSLDGAPGYFFTEAVNLLEEKDVALLINAIKDRSVPPVLVVIDTLSRCMGAGDENSAKDMGRAVRALGAIQKFFGCAVLVLHHTGHRNEERERGSSALRAAVDVLIVAHKTDDGLVLRSEKCRDGAPFEDLTVRLAQVPIAGETSCVAELGTRVPPAGRRLSGNALRALKSLAESSDGLTHAEWVRAAGIAKSSLDAVLQDLKRGGYIEKTGTGWGARYEVTQKGKEALGPDQTEVGPIGPIAPRVIGPDRTTPPIGGGPIGPTLVPAGEGFSSQKRLPSQKILSGHDELFADPGLVDCEPLPARSAAPRSTVTQLTPTERDELLHLLHAARKAGASDDEVMALAEKYLTARLALSDHGPDGPEAEA